MAYQSEIRDTQLNQLSDKVERNNYGKYLKKLRLNPIRGFDDDTIKFDFPVTAIIGPNGGGKTTVLGAAACAYISIKPSRFFAKSGRFDNNMQNWKIVYELIDRDINRSDSVSRTSKFTNFKWSRDHISRTVSIFGVSRTVPVSERPEFSKCATNKFTVSVDRISGLGESVITAAQKILGKDLSNYSRISVDMNGKVTLLTGMAENGTEFSEFHFGAGESSIIKMVYEIESIQPNSLVLIEEIENGLHPVATIRMVEYLLEVALRKSIQVIFTTHSNEALMPLPAKAIWAAVNHTFFQGKLDVKSLRAITGQVNAKLAIFVEDDFAKLWLESILATMSDFHHDEIEVHVMQGDGTAVTLNRHHNQDPTRTYSSICVIDGDSMQQESERDKVYRLPGQSPESYLYDMVLEKVNSTAGDSVLGELTIALHKPYEIQEEIKIILNEVRRTNRDYHLLFSQVGKKIGFISEVVVKSAFINIWIRSFPDEYNQIVENIRRNNITNTNQPASIGE